MQRAYGVFIGGLWPKSENSTYTHAFDDVEKRALTGDQSYRLFFEAGKLPPATDFWSVTVYDSGTYDLCPNPYERYSVGSNDPNVIYGEDGSLEIIFQHDRPDDFEQTNWLAIPDSAFWLGIRFYAPIPVVRDFTYRLPPVVRR